MSAFDIASTALSISLSAVLGAELPAPTPDGANGWCVALEEATHCCLDGEGVRVIYGVAPRSGGEPAWKREEPACILAKHTRNEILDPPSAVPEATYDPVFDRSHSILLAIENYETKNRILSEREALTLDQLRALANVYARPAVSEDASTRVPSFLLQSQAIEKYPTLTEDRNVDSAAAIEGLLFVVGETGSPSLVVNGQEIRCGPGEWIMVQIQPSFDAECVRMTDSTMEADTPAVSNSQSTDSQAASTDRTSPSPQMSSSRVRPMTRTELIEKQCRSVPVQLSFAPHVTALRLECSQ